MQVASMRPRLLRSSRVMSATAQRALAGSQRGAVGARAPARRRMPRRAAVQVHARRAGWADAEPAQIDMVDYYEMLGVQPTAPVTEIKKAYYNLAKECHPDVMGEAGHNACILINEAYDVLKDEDSRAWYSSQLAQAKMDFADGYTGKPRSKWRGEAGEERAVFVDECACIGCKQCIWAAPATFRLEPVHGRSYVFGQWFNEEDDIQTAIDACPVSCIHWVEKAQLPVLEFVMANIDRVGVGIMMAGQGNVTDPFDAAATYSKQRSEKLKERAKAEKKRQQSDLVKQQRREAAEVVRKRRAEWAEMLRRRPGQGYTVPLERAIVPYVEGMDDVDRASMDEFFEALEALEDMDRLEAEKAASEA